MTKYFVNKSSTWQCAYTRVTLPQGWIKTHRTSHMHTPTHMRRQLSFISLASALNFLRAATKHFCSSKHFHLSIYHFFLSLPQFASHYFLNSQVASHCGISNRVNYLLWGELVWRLSAGCWCLIVSLFPEIQTRFLQLAFNCIYCC